ncbi:ATP-binding protein [Thiofilum flexile]|uniref:ATP-binding protein n=1 Tax=Thiofilum flexile TaxID=125627 RepID=UPI0003687BA2|nr:ATP-binding protein [Thiofilum flexile]
MSLKQRLLLILLSAITGLWLVASLSIYYHSKHEVNEILDAHLAQTAALLMAQGLDQYDDDDYEDDDIDTEHAPLLHKYSRRVAFQLWYKGERLTLHSQNAPNTLLSHQLEGLSESVVDQQRWRVFSAWDEDRTHLVQVAELIILREEVIHDMTNNLVLALVIALPIIAGLIWWGASWGLKPLVVLAQLIAHREPHSLTPIELSAPAEVRPLIERLNSLFQRIQIMLDNERRFTADAAHELRTPIAGISAQVQVAQYATQELERQHALVYALQGCQRATHLITQLLTLARLESTANAQLQPCKLHTLAAEVLSELAPQAHEAGISLELIESDNVEVMGLPLLLQVLIRNLVDNAIRYTPPHTLITISIYNTPMPTLMVSDNGQGLSEAEMAKISQRFYRVLGSKASGSGLGLSIVERIAEIHQARVTFSKPATSQGLQVTIHFPNSHSIIRS